MAYIEIRSTFFLDKLRMVVLNEKMGLNHVLKSKWVWKVYIPDIRIEWGLGNIFLPFLYNFTLKNVNFPCLVW